MASVEALSDVFAGVLRRGRERFNARFLQAHALGKTIDADRFKQLLHDGVAPIADAVWRVQRERVDAVAAVAYDVLLDLLGDGVIDRHPRIIDCWRRVLTAIPWLLAEQPREVIASLTNAIVNVESPSWTDLMAAIAPEARDLGTLRALGHVVAWRCGLAQHRLGALESCAALPEGLALKAMGVTGELPQILDRLRADRWLTPERAAIPPTRRSLRLVRAVSGFRGFGGAFVTPPEVVSAGGFLVARDRQSSWVITADVFGTHLQRFMGDVPAPALDARCRIGRGGKVSFGGERAVFPDFADFSSIACDDSTVAVTVDRSHSVFLIALQ